MLIRMVRQAMRDGAQEIEIDLEATTYIPPDSMDHLCRLANNRNIFFINMSPKVSDEFALTLKGLKSQHE